MACWGVRCDNTHLHKRWDPAKNCGILSLSLIIIKNVVCCHTSPHTPVKKDFRYCTYSTKNTTNTNYSLKFSHHTVSKYRRVSWPSVYVYNTYIFLSNRTTRVLRPQRSAEVLCLPNSFSLFLSIPFSISVSAYSIIVYHHANIIHPDTVSRCSFI